MPIGHTPCFVSIPFKMFLSIQSKAFFSDRAAVKYDSSLPTICFFPPKFILSSADLLEQYKQRHSSLFQLYREIQEVQQQGGQKKLDLRLRLKDTEMHQEETVKETLSIELQLKSTSKVWEQLKSGKEAGVIRCFP